MVLEQREKRERDAEEQAPDPDAPIPVLRPQDDERRMGAYRIEKMEDGSIVVRGKRIEQFTKMVDFANRSAIERFRDVVERTGLLKALQKNGWKDEEKVFIGNIQVDEHL